MTEDYTPPVLLIGRTPVQRFADALIMAGHEPGAGLRWRPFLSTRAVRAELERRGYELVMHGADERGDLLRFFAMRRVLLNGDLEAWKAFHVGREQTRTDRAALTYDLDALARELGR